MSTTEELWFLVAIGGFLLFMEGALIVIGKTILRNKISEEMLKVTAGIIIFIIAIIYLMNLPR